MSDLGLTLSVLSKCYSFSEWVTTTNWILPVVLFLATWPRGAEPQHNERIWSKESSRSSLRPWSLHYWCYKPYVSSATPEIHVQCMRHGTYWHSILSTTQIARCLAKLQLSRFLVSVYSYIMYCASAPMDVIFITQTLCQILNTRYH